MKVFGHRGVRRRGVDENTIDAIKRAVDMGVDGIEFDLHASRDGCAIVTHDKDLRRIAGDNRRISELTSKELKQIHLRHGTNIPTLDDVTASIPPPIEMDFEVKDIKVLNLLITKLRTSASLRERALISSFQKRVLETAARELPEVRRVLLVRRWMRSKPALEWSRQVGLYAIGLPHRFWTKKRHALVKEAGLHTFTWEYHFNRSHRRRAERLRKLGIDVAIVNQPEAYRSFE